MSDPFRPPLPAGSAGTGSGQPVYVDPVTGTPIHVDPVTGQLRYDGVSPAPDAPATATPATAVPATATPATALPVTATPPGLAYPYAGGYAYPVAQGYAINPSPKLNSMALAAFIVTVVGCGLAGIVATITGAILGHVALRQIKQRGERGNGLALAACIIGWTLTALIGSLFIIGIVLSVTDNS